VASIGLRVARTLLAWALLWGMALALGAAWAVRHEMSEMQDDALRSTAEVLIGSLAAQDLRAEAPRPAATAPLPEGDPDLNVSCGRCCRGERVDSSWANEPRCAPAGPLHAHAGGRLCHRAGLARLRRAVAEAGRLAAGGAIGR
jgi:hypothetical protein